MKQFFQRLKHVILMAVVVGVVLISSNTAQAADDDFAQIRIEALSPVAQITISGVNQNDDGTTWQQNYNYDQNIIGVSVNNWWWRFKYTCFIIVQCGSTEDYSPSVWVRYFDGHLAYQQCHLNNNNVTRSGQWVTCRFDYMSSYFPGDPDAPGNPDDPGAPGDPADPNRDGDGDGVPDSLDWCPSRGSEGYGVDDHGCPIPPPPNLSIAITAITQAVYNIDINSDGVNDLVHGKPLVVMVHPTITEPYRLDGQSTIDIVVTARYSNNTSVTLAYLGGNITVKQILDLKQDETLKFYLDSGPTIIGNVEFTATIDPNNAIPESDESNNSSTARAEVKDTRPIRLAAMSVIWQELNSQTRYTVSDLQGVIDRGMTLTKATYPLNPNELTVNMTGINLDLNALMKTNPLPAYLNGKTPFTTTVNGGAVLITIVENAGSRSDGNAQQYVGILPRAASLYYGNGGELFGQAESIGGGNSFIVFENSPTKTFPHEMGHNYGLMHQTASVDGYSVLNRQSINNYTTLIQQGRFDNAWISSDDYKTLFRQFRTNPADPELIIFAGFTSDSGDVDLLPLFYNPEGIPTDDAGTNALELMDINGNIVHTMPFMIHHEIDGDPTSFGFFSFKSYFPEDAISANFVDGTGTILNINLHSTLLRDYINSIPDAGFGKNATQRRNALLNQISALETQYAQANINGIVNHLIEIRARTNQWVLGSYAINTPYQVTKSQVLSLIDELITRVQSMNP